MNFDELMRKTGKPGDWREAMDEIRAEHGKGASRWLADRLNVTQRTAQRWMSGQHAPGGRGARGDAAKRSVVDAVDDRKAAARHLRSATRLVIGDITLQASSFSGKRSVGEFPVTGAMRDALDRVADAIDRGDPGAEDMFGKVVLDAYFSKGNAGGRHAQSSMGITEYGSGAYILGD